MKSMLALIFGVAEGWEALERRIKRSMQEFPKEPFYTYTKEIPGRGLADSTKEGNSSLTGVGTVAYGTTGLQPLFRSRKNSISLKNLLQEYVLGLSRAFEMSGVVAREVSGRHSHLEEVAYETDGGVTGDPEDYINSFPADQDSVPIPIPDTIAVHSSGHFAMRRFFLVLLLLAAAAVPVQAQTDAKPPVLVPLDDSVQPDVTIIQNESETVEEYRTGE